MNTQGENIADNGGIKQSYLVRCSVAKIVPLTIKDLFFQAYKNTLEGTDEVLDESLPGLENLSGDQLFFLNFAQVWCGSIRQEALRFKLKNAVHAPGKYRVLGTLSNSEEFSKAFNCPRGLTRMNPNGKCSIW